MPPRYINDAFRRMVENNTQPLGHDTVTGLWTHIFGRYYSMDDDFFIKPEAMLPYRPNERADEIVALLNIKGVIESTCIVLEVKPEGNADTWDAARGQAYGYIKAGLNKKTHKTIGIVAKGRKFVMFEVPGGNADSLSHFVNLGLNNDGTQHPLGVPYDIIDHADHLEQHLLQIWTDAKNGEFIDKLLT